MICSRNDICGAALPARPSPGIRALVFDIDDTLYLRTVPYLSAVREFFPEQKSIDEDALFRRNMQMSDEEYDRYVRGETSFDEMHVLRVQRTLEPFGITVSDEEARAFQRCYEKKQSEIRMTDGFRDVLEMAAERKMSPAISASRSRMCGFSANLKGGPGWLRRIFGWSVTPMPRILRAPAGQAGTRSGSSGNTSPIPIIRSSRRGNIGRTIGSRMSEKSGS